MVCVYMSALLYDNQGPWQERGKLMAEKEIIQM